MLHYKQHVFSIILSINFKISILLSRFMSLSHFSLGNRFHCIKSHFPSPPGEIYRMQFALSPLSRREEKTGKRERSAASNWVSRSQGRVIARQPMVSPVTARATWCVPISMAARGAFIIACPSIYGAIRVPIHQDDRVNRVTPRLQLGDMQLVSATSTTTRWRRG